MTWNPATKFVGIDTETTGIARFDYPFAVSLCDDTGNTEWFEWDVNTETRKPKVKKKDIVKIQKRCKGKQLVFHNKSFDLQKLDLIGCKLDWRGKSHDTMYMSHVFNSNTHTELNGRLKEISLVYLDFDDEDQFELRQAIIKARALVKKFDLGWAIAPNKKGDDHIARDFWLPKTFVTEAWEHVPDKESYDDPIFHPWYSLCAKYGNGDTERTMLLFLALRENGFNQWDKDDKRHFILNREQKLSDTIYDMQQVGLSLSPEKIEQKVKNAEKIIKKETKLMTSLSGVEEFNPESGYHMSDALFGNLKFPTKLSAETKNSSEERRLYKTNKNIRKDLEDWMGSQSQSKTNKRRFEFVESLQRYKEAHVVVDYLPQYYDKQIDRRLYAFLKQTGTATTRLSSSNPNGQNINELLREVFGPFDDRIWYCLDYSQLQLRIFAYITQEKSMIDAFAAGYDFHGFVASKIFGMDIEEVNSDKAKRRIGKNVNFGFIFGASPRKIEQTAGISGLWDTVVKMFPSAHKYMESTKRQVRQHGYVTTPHGYRLYCNKPHAGVNYIVQGCEGDIVKEGMNNCDEYLKSLNDYDADMMFQVHDELDFDMIRPTTKKQIKHQQCVVEDLKQLMEQPGEDIGMITPVDVEYTTTNWKDTVKGYYLGV